MWHNAVDLQNRDPESTGADKLEPVWVGVLSLESAKRFHLAVVLLIAALVFLSPAGAVGEGATDFVLRFSLANARDKAVASAFPLALGISYTFAVVAALFGAVSVCFTRGHIAGLHQLIEGKSVVSRTILVLGLILLNAVPYVIALHSWPGQYSAYVTQAIEQSRLALLIVCEGLYIGGTATITWVLYELTNAFRAAFGVKKK